MDIVLRQDLRITVTVGGISATKQYADGQSSRRAEESLKKSALARTNFFRPPRQKR